MTLAEGLDRQKIEKLLKARCVTFSGEGATAAALPAAGS